MKLRIFRVSSSIFKVGAVKQTTPLIRWWTTSIAQLLVPRQSCRVCTSVHTADADWKDCKKPNMFRLQIFLSRLSCLVCNLFTPPTPTAADATKQSCRRCEQTADANETRRSCLVRVGGVNRIPDGCRQLSRETRQDRLVSSDRRWEQNSRRHQTNFLKTAKDGLVSSASAVWTVSRRDETRLSCLVWSVVWTELQTRQDSLVSSRRRCEIAFSLTDRAAWVQTPQCRTIAN